MRMFVAIEVPRGLAETLADDLPDLPGMRAVSPEMMHVTLCFIGHVEDDGPLKKRLSGVRSEPPELTISGAGSFGGSRGRPRVLWAGVADANGRLAELQRKITEAVGPRGPSRKERDFHPHVTLARGRSRDPATLDSFIETRRERGYGAFTATCFTLFSSELRSEGAVYHSELRCELG